MTIIAATITGLNDAVAAVVALIDDVDFVGLCITKYIEVVVDQFKLL